MKKVIINGSARNGNILTAINAFMKGAADRNAIEVIQPDKLHISPCKGCGVCQCHKGCVDNDDTNPTIDKLAAADMILFATPVYFAHPSGRIYDFLDRVFYSAGGYDAFKFKPGAAVAVARRGGTTAALDGINKYFGIAQMPVAGSTYWNMVHGLYGEEAFQDEEGMQTMRNLARNMIWMMRCFKLGRESGILYPETETDACTNFIKRSDTLR